MILARTIQAFSVAILGSLCAGCATHFARAPLNNFLAGDLDTTRAFFDRQVREGDVASGALYLNGLAQIEMLQGELGRARRHFRDAGRIMGNWATSSSEVIAAIVGSESSKTWKGDPYEKAMNAYYTGLLYWITGEPDNGRAAFKKGILADGESEEGDYQVDFALLFWLAGRTSLLMGLPEDAESYFEEARRAREFAVQHGAGGLPSPRVLEDPAAGNLVCLVDIGLGPEKVVGGGKGELAVIVPRRPTVRWAEIFVDGHSLGTTELLVDVDYQASTRGGTVMEGIRKGKAVLRTVSEVAGAVLIYDGVNRGGDAGRNQALAGLGLLLLSLLTSSAADIRHWETLPAGVHVLTANIPPGPHDLRIEFRGAGGRFSRLTQNWTIEIPEKGESVYYFRSLPGLDKVGEEQS